MTSIIDVMTLLVLLAILAGGIFVWASLGDVILGALGGKLEEIRRAIISDDDNT